MRAKHVVNAAAIAVLIAGLAACDRTETAEQTPPAAIEQSGMPTPVAGEAEPGATQPVIAEPEPVAEQEPTAEPERRRPRTGPGERGDQQPGAQPEQRRAAVRVVVPAGTSFDVEFLDAVSSARSAVGEQFEARVVDDVIVNGVAAIPAGSRVVGTVTEAVGLGRVGGRARLTLRFDRLELPSGDTPAIAATFTAEGTSETGRDAATIGGAAAGGAILGRAIDKKNRDRGTVIGAIVGGAVGTVIASKSPGEEVVIDPGSVVGLTLEAPAQVLLHE